MKIADLILSHFKGRPDYVAVSNGATFSPEKIESPLTAARLQSDHLSGSRCLGFYVLDEESKCRCTCVDFDNKAESPDPEFMAKAETLYFALVGCGLHPVVELSQSGIGVHVWLFFSEPTDAWIARSWWRAVEMKIDAKFIEIYPRQDRLSGKGLGNLVRYPLFNRSVFIDPENPGSILDAEEVLSSIQSTTGGDLRLISFQAGMGELSPESRVEASAIIEGGELLSSRVQKLAAETTTLLGRRWANDPVGMKDKSRSAVAMSLCCELVRAYVPTPEISAALRHWCRQHGAESKGDRDKWVNDTVTKAYGFVTEKREVKSVSATTFRDAAHAYIDLIERGQQVYVPSGIPDLDSSIDGVAPGEVAIIAGRPSHGKSALGVQWIDNAAGFGTAGLFISEEMGALEIGKRRVQAISQIPQDHWVAASASFLRKDVDAHHRNRADVYLVESCSTVDRVEEIIDQFVTLYGVGLVAIDYLQLLGSRKGKDRYEVVTEVSRRIKQAARRNNVAILLLCQLNRQVENRDDNDPRMSDLRESGGIEQDADLIIFAQYPCKFDVSQPEDLYRFVIGKRRNGPIRKARIELNFNPHRQLLGGIEMPAELMDL